MKAMGELNINGKIYVLKSDVENNTSVIESMDYVIIITYSAGVFAGYLFSREGKEAIIKHSRRLWHWTGASTLSQLAMEGTSNPADCKFPYEVFHTELTEVIEVIKCTKKAKLSIEGVSIWAQ